MEEIEEAVRPATSPSPRQPSQPSGHVLIEGEDLAASSSPARDPWEAPNIEVRNAWAEARCPRCQSALGAEARYCDVCGAGVRDAASGALGEPTASLLQEPESQHPELVPVVASGRLALTLGGYAEQPQSPEAEPLSPERRRRVKRILIGAAVLVAIVVLAVAVLLSLSRRPASRSTEHLASAAAAPEKKATPDKKETPKLLPAEFSVDAIEKEDQFAGGHAHVIVKLDEQALFIIRDEGEYSSPVDRARAVSDNLRRAMANLKRDPGAEFRVVNGAEGPTITQIIAQPTGEKEIPILTVTQHDAKGYVRRSHRSVTASQLAEWWLNRLKDRVAVFVKGEAPRLTVTNEDGRLLGEVYERAEKGSIDGRPSREALDQALQTLTPEQRRFLSYEGVRTLPEPAGHHSH